MFNANSFQAWNSWTLHDEFVNGEYSPPRSQFAALHASYFQAQICQTVQTLLVTVLRQFIMFQCMKIIPELCMLVCWYWQDQSGKTVSELMKFNSE